MKKLTRKETAKISGGIAPGQCLYWGSDGHTKLGCLLPSFRDSNGVWVTPNPETACQPCKGDL